MNVKRWIGLSLALHALALWLLARAPQQSHANVPPVQMRIVQPPPSAVVAVAAQPPKRTGQRVAPSAADSKPSNPSPPPPSYSPRLSAPVTVPNDGSGGVVLPNGLAIMGLAGPPPKAPAPSGFLSAFQDDGLDEETRVNGRLKATTDAIAVQLDTGTGARGTARTLRKALQDNFAPEGKLVADIPGSSEAFAQMAVNLRDGYKRPQSTASADAARPGPQATFDPCSASHEIGRRELTVRADHDEQGQVTKVTTVKSSGKQPYDQYAETVVREALQKKLPMESDEAVPLFSEWALAQVVYDWMSTPQCFDPQMRPVGRPVYPNATLPFAITYTNEVKLKAVRYRRASRSK